MSAPLLTRTVAETRAALAERPRPLGLVPTMGAFHDGHLTLMRAARARCATVAVSLFVNPTQFGSDDDLRRYPRDEARDLRLAGETGADLVFAPPVDEMYHPDAATGVHIGGRVTEAYEATQRPGHFDGVATVVAKLLGIVVPDLAFFGRKDAQQLAVIATMARDLDVATAIVGVDTVREPDGLAMSSRNARLTEAQRAKAPDLHRALLAGRAVAPAGRKAVVDEVTARLVLGFPPYPSVADADAPAGPQFSVDYVDVVDPVSFARVDEPVPESIIIAAVCLGETRLLDNVSVGDLAAELEDDFNEGLPG